MTADQTARCMSLSRKSDDLVQFIGRSIRILSENGGMRSIADDDKDVTRSRCRLRHFLQKRHGVNSENVQKCGSHPATRRRRLPRSVQIILQIVFVYPMESNFSLHGRPRLTASDATMFSFVIRISVFVVVLCLWKHRRQGISQSTRERSELHESVASKSATFPQSLAYSIDGFSLRRLIACCPPNYILPRCCGHLSSRLEEPRIIPGSKSLMPCKRSDWTSLTVRLFWTPTNRRA